MTYQPQEYKVLEETYRGDGPPQPGHGTYSPSTPYQDSSTLPGQLDFFAANDAWPIGVFPMSAEPAQT